MENAKITNLYNLDETIAKEYLSQFTYPWEALAGISDFIKELGPTLDPESSDHLLFRQKPFQADPRPESTARERIDRRTCQKTDSTAF